MPSLDRRRFLQVAGGTTAATMLTESVARAAALPANRRTGSLEDVEHIVVLMQENRSFDHYFGTLRGVRGFGDPHPASLPNGKPVWHQPDGTTEVLPFRPDMEDLGLVFLEDLAHGWTDTQDAFNRGQYDRWIPNKTTTTMAHLRRGDAPFHFALADAFTVCDAYHCSFIGNTDPNRYYMWTGWTGNDGKGGGPVLYNDEAGYDWTTYPERLQEAGVSWKIYQDVGEGLDQAHSWGWTGDPYIGNYGDNSLLYFHQYQNSAPGSPLHERALTGTNVAKSGGYFDVLRNDVRTGKLPQVSWIVAPEAFTEHPNWPVNYGAWYVAQVLDALTSNPEVWSKTALLITYDENDGFFDHVVPPHPNTPLVPGDSTVPLDNEFYTGPAGPGAYGLGPAGTDDRGLALEHRGLGVLGDVRPHLDHPADGATVRRHGAKHHALASSRLRRPDLRVRLLAIDVAGAHAARHRGVRAAGPRATPGLPPDASGDRCPASSGARHATGAPGRLRPHGPRACPGHPPDAHAGELGRDRRPLPGTFPRAGRTSTQLHRRRRGPAPVDWPTAGPYDVTLHGPDGFFRRFSGDRAQDSVTASVHGRAERITVTVSTLGSPAVVTLANAYSPDRSKTVRLAAGRHHDFQVETRGTGGWYDLVVTVQGSAFVRQFAGHLTNGRPSVSDPALGR